MSPKVCGEIECPLVTKKYNTSRLFQTFCNVHLCVILFEPKRLTAHNWQKSKEYSWHVPGHGHEVYRDEAVGLKIYKYTLKITIYVNMWNLGQFRENLIFCQ